MDETQSISVSPVHFSKKSIQTVLNRRALSSIRCLATKITFSKMILVSVSVLVSACVKDHRVMSSEREEL